MVKTDLQKIQVQPQPSKQMKALTSPTPPPPSSSACKKKKYKGVRMRSWGSWVSEIRAPNQKTRIWLGSYSTPEAAARAYDAALLCLKGSSANLNFPITSSHYIPDPDTLLSPKSIQRVAAAAANSFVVGHGVSSAATPPISPPPPSTSSSSPASSPSMSSSPSDHQPFLQKCWARFARRIIANLPDKGNNRVLESLKNWFIPFEHPQV
ncbi:hypothetical protein GOBAR_DD32482 [Gossypium barbadense]|nr:hypothetical protein GOBAR_DD32482 [Gossypium barbadense]